MNAYTVEVTFTQYDHMRTKSYFVGAKDMNGAKSSAARKFWDDYGEKPNVRIFSFTVTEYN